MRSVSEAIPSTMHRQHHLSGPGSLVQCSSCCFEPSWHFPLGKIKRQLELQRSFFSLVFLWNKSRNFRLKIYFKNLICFPFQALTLSFPLNLGIHRLEERKGVRRKNDRNQCYFWVLTMYLAQSHNTLPYLSLTITARGKFYMILIL